MICRHCKGPRHRDERGRFVAWTKACPFTKSVEYRIFKADFYGEMERLMEPNLFYGPKF